MSTGTTDHQNVDTARGKPVPPRGVGGKRNNPPLYSIGDTPVPSMDQVFRVFFFAAGKRMLFRINR